MQAPRLWPLVVLLALVIGAAVALRSCGEPAPEPPPPLTAQALETYLAVAPVLRAERHAARAEGSRPAVWHERPGFRAALDGVGWSLDDYLRIEGQVSAARLALEDPEIFEREFEPTDAPPAARELVRSRLADVQRVQAPLTD